MKTALAGALALMIIVSVGGCGRKEEEAPRPPARVNVTTPTQTAQPRPAADRRDGQRPVRDSLVATETTGVAAPESAAQATTATETTAPVEVLTTPTVAATATPAAEPQPPRPVVVSVEPRQFDPPPPGEVLPLKLTLTGSHLGQVRVFLREGEEEALLTVSGVQTDEQVEVIAGPFSHNSRGTYDIVVRDDQGAEVVVPQALQARP